MGCQSSSTYVQQPMANRTTQNYNNNSSSMFYQMQNAKRPRFLNSQHLAQQQKDTLWRIIQSDSLKEFAYFVQNQRIPSNAEVGPANTFWNFAHFCCRWNAFQCLYYMIKRIYSENSSLLLSFINQQSIQGYTAMHVAIEWDSLNCFFMLLDCGGVDLSYTDKANNDVFAKANLFKRTQMLEILQRFRTGNALMVLVQSEKTRGFKDYSQAIFMGSVETQKQFRLSNQRIAEIIDSRNRLNRPPAPIIPPVQNNQQNLQAYNNKMKQIQAQKRQNTSTQSYGEQGQGDSIMLQKLLQQRKFQQEQNLIKKKREEELRKSLEMQRKQEEIRLQQQQARQINQERIYEQEELQKIEKEKQLIRRNIQAMQSNNAINVNFAGGKPKMSCPEDIKPIYEAALAKKTKFVDETFPAELSSLGNVNDFKFGWNECVWLRPEQIFPGGQFEVFDGISPEDVKQGALSVCYYLAFLSSIAENEQRIKKIFRFYDKELGFYALQFYLQGKPLTIIVDDQIPCMGGTNQPLFSKPRSAQTWVMIFEKAWVKMFGSYLAAQLMAMVDMFENVLPAPFRQQIIDVAKIESTFDKLVEYDKLHYIMTATSRSDEAPPGIVKEHAYSLIGAYDINGVKLCKIRNPWGKTEYAGMYSQGSSLWTPQLQQAVGYQPGDDGIFYLTPTELQSILPAITISYYKDNYEYSFIEIQSSSNEELYYVFNVKKSAQIAIKVTQQNQRFRKDMEYENAPIRLQVWKLGENYDAKVISEGQPSTMYHGCFALYSHQQLFQKLQAGRYLIRLKVLYDRTYHVSTRGSMRKFIRGTDGKDYLNVRNGKCVLSIYGPEYYIFNKLDTTEAQKYMKNAYHNFIVQSPNSKERLRSCGQDLMPTVISKDCRMRNQIIYLAQNHFPSHSINFKFQFSYEKFRNCSFGFNVDKETQACEWVIEPGGWNICTLEVDCPFQELASEATLSPTFKIIR